MEYGKLVELYQKLEATTKKLEMTDILAEFLKGVEPKILPEVILLTMGRIFPEWEQKEVGVAANLMVQAIKKATGRKVVCTTDIGCYALGIQPPLRVGDALICMGASLGLACGISKATNSRTVAVVGDSTFFHAAIPGLINAAYNKHKITVAVLDNETTAMTGDQPHPGTGITGMGVPGKRILIEEVAKACGADYVKVVNPFNLKEATETFKEALQVDGVSVVVFRQPCRLLVVRKARKEGKKLPVAVVTEDCTNCKTCIEDFGCPAFYIKDGAILIDPLLCTGCMVCVQVCPYGAIKAERREAE